MHLSVAGARRHNNFQERPPPTHAPGALTGGGGPARSRGGRAARDRRSRGRILKRVCMCGHRVGCVGGISRFGGMGCTDAGRQLEHQTSSYAKMRTHLPPSEALPRPGVPPPAQKRVSRRAGPVVVYIHIQSISTSHFCGLQHQAGAHAHRLTRSPLRSLGRTTWQLSMIKGWRTPSNPMS